MGREWYKSNCHLIFENHWSLIFKKTGCSVLGGCTHQKVSIQALVHVPSVPYSSSTSVPTGGILKPRFYTIFFPLHTPLSAHACTYNPPVGTDVEAAGSLSVHVHTLSTYMSHIGANLGLVSSLALLID